MNRIKYILLGLLLTIIFIPNVSAKGVEITSITLDNKSNNTVINSNPTHNGLEMNFDIGFKEKNDFVKYKVVVKNNTNTDYKISNDTSFNESSFITYKYETEGNLKAKSELIVYVTITYSNEIDQTLLVNDRYSESNKAVLTLLDKEGNLTNPNTGINIYIIILLIVFSLVVSIILLKNKKKVLIPVIIFLLLIPTLVYAVETFRLTINVDVEILKGYKVSYSLSGVFSDEELKDYDTTYATCSIVYYIGEVKYNSCNYVIQTDKKLYSPGERVNFLPLSKKNIQTSAYNGNEWISLCNEQEEYVYYCEPNTTLKSYDIELLWYMNKTPEIAEEYPLLDTDKETMNFSNIAADRWEKTGQNARHLILEASESFNMPKHNVLFDTEGFSY